MSMLLSIARLTPATVAAVRADPTLVTDLLDAQLAPAPAKSGMLGRLFGRTPPPPPKPRVPPVADVDRLDLEQHWHILHYLFTGSAWEGEAPAAFLASGGSPIGRDLGYGPPRLFDAGALAATATWLAGLSPAALAHRYDPAAIAAAEIYWTASASPDDSAAELAMLWETVLGLRDFLAETARRGDSILVEIY